MNSRRCFLLLSWSVACLLGFHVEVTGQLGSDPAVRWDRAKAGQFESTDPTLTVGWEFKVLETFNITSIGVFDTELGLAPQGGLATSKSIGLWDVQQQALALSTVPAGTAATLCQDGYRYVSLGSPVTLVAGRRYVVAAFWQGDSGGADFDDYPDLEGSDTPFEVNSRIEFIQPRRRETPVFGFPNVPLPGTKKYLGAVNFRIGPGACEPNPAPGVVTTFVGGNNQAGNMFDVRARRPGGLSVTSWQVNLDNAAANDTLVRVTIYWRKGTHVGHTDSPDGWELLGSQNVLSWGPNQATPVPIGGLDLPFGQTIGIYITTNFELGVEGPPPLRYTNVGIVPAVVSNADITVIAGVGKGTPFFDGVTIADRMWNGGIVYKPAGTWLNLGCGLAGTFGEPQLSAAGTLAPNSPLALGVSNGLPLVTAFIVFGTTKANSPFAGGILVPTPLVTEAIPLSILGEQTLSTTWPGGFPSGSQVFLQVWTPDPVAPAGLAASNALQGTVP